MIKAGRRDGLEPEAGWVKRLLLGRGLLVSCRQHFCSMEMRELITNHYRKVGWEVASKNASGGLGAIAETDFLWFPHHLVPCLFVNLRWHLSLATFLEFV